jgi:CHAT domain-containing protein
MKRKYRFKLWFLIGLSCCFLLNALPVLSLPTPTNVTGQTPITSAQAKAVGNEHYQAGQYSQAIAFWERALELASASEDKASIQGHLGSAYRQLGQLNEAIEQWVGAIQIYQKDKDSSNLAEVLADLAQAYTALGQFRPAIERAHQAIDIARTNRQRETQTVAQGVLGNAYSLAGDYEKALSAYRASMELATQLNNPVYITTALNNQVNILIVRSRRYRLQAESAGREGDEQEQKRLTKLSQQNEIAAQKAATHGLRESKASGGIPQVRALLNMIRLSEQSSSLPKQSLEDYQQQLDALIEKLPDSRSKAFALIKLSETASAAAKVKLLKESIKLAQNIGDSYTQSFAQGALGHVYESKGQLPTAIELTREAQLAAQQVNAFDSLYRWQWQAGRIQQASGLTAEAIASYKQAIASLQNIRGDIAVANQDLQFDFRDDVESVYRQLINLLLKGKSDSSKIKDALQISDLLKLTQLQNFFNDDCLEIKKGISVSKNFRAKTNEAWIHSIVLDQQTWMILRLPNGMIKKYLVPLTAKQLQKEIDNFRYLLEDISTDKYLNSSKKVYDLLLRPMARDLEEAKINSLVFVNDNLLQKVSMAALHDGQRYLVQKYALASTLGLKPVSSQEKQQNGKALSFGLTLAVGSFSALPNVAAETQAVQNIMGGERFLDQEFTLKNLEKQIQAEHFPIIHIATHGRFGGSADTTFLQAYDSRISLNEFEKLLSLRKDNDIELITLSSCQTAAGDNRATLGLAGLAIRNNVNNVLASLWSINDADTSQLVKDFYSSLQTTTTSKAEALRSAQLKLIADPASQHPSIWSAFILVNS